MYRSGPLQGTLDPSGIYTDHSAREQSGSPIFRWWIPGDGIEREVIQANIQRFLGHEATSWPTSAADGTPIYLIAALRNLMKEEIHQLEQITEAWRKERQQRHISVRHETGGRDRSQELPNTHHTQVHRVANDMGDCSSTLSTITAFLCNQSKRESLQDPMPKLPARSWRDLEDQFIQWSRNVGFLEPVNSPLSFGRRFQDDAGLLQQIELIVTMLQSTLQIAMEIIHGRRDDAEIPQLLSLASSSDSGSSEGSLAEDAAEIVDAAQDITQDQLVVPTTELQEAYRASRSYVDSLFRLISFLPSTMCADELTMRRMRKLSILDGLKASYFDTDLEMLSQQDASQDAHQFVAVKDNSNDSRSEKEPVGRLLPNGTFQQANPEPSSEIRWSWWIPDDILEEVMEIEICYYLGGDARFKRAVIEVNSINSIEVHQMANVSRRNLSI